MNFQNPFDGRWTYRSFRNDPDPGASFNSLRFGQGTLELSSNDVGEISGTLGGDGWSLELQGNYSLGNPFTVRFQGRGEINDEPWVYDYLGYRVPVWPNGIAQRNAIAGTIVRTVTHSNGSSPAGYVASWLAVAIDGC